MPSPSRILYFCFAAILTFAAGLSAQTSTGPNSDPTYQLLRNIGLGSEAVSVNDVTLKRDAATFHLHSGNVCFVSAVQGKVTGAVFVGEGNMVLDPPLGIERGTLRLLTKENEFSEKFSQLVMRFTDSTYEEIKKAGGTATAACDPALLRDSQNALHHNRALRFNLDARILQDVGATSPGGLFVAFIHGQRYSDKEVFAIDPHGAHLLFDVAPEEVELITYDDNKTGVWAAFHFSNEYKQGTASGSQNNGLIRIDHQQLDTTIEKNGTLTGKATTTFVSQVNGLNVVPFDLFPALRVQSVTAEGGQPLSFIQQGKDEDAEFFSVILPKPLASGEKYSIVTTYSGKEAVSNEGNGNYFPVARDNWYPNNTGQAFGGFTNYDMTFRIPKGMKIAATGTLVNESNDGDHAVSVWKSEVPQTVAGFNFGNFNVQEAKITKPDYLVQSYANKEPPLWVKNLQRQANGEDNLEVEHDYIGGRAEVALGNMNTTPMQKKALADGEISMEVYTDYFGPIPFKRLAMTQQTACTFGQSWPTLVWLPICAFYDNTVRHQLGLDRGDRGYWKTVAPHEVAHQWWGNQVGFSSYRDQWMSEGFADMSASLFLQIVDKNPKRFIDFWNDERELLTMKEPKGFRAIDAGPVTLGYRMSNSRTGMNLTRDLIYPKGAYILHMVRMMMWDKRTGDQNFKATMQDFVKTYAGRAATTEDFKAMVEKHMTPEMAAFGSGKMDWFFDEYVYGTQLPNYNLQSSIGSNAAGDMEFSFKLAQSNVDANFRMLVPLYIELADGSVRFLGRAPLMGNTSLEQKIPLKGLKDKPHRLLVNYYDDVLASAN